MFGGFFFYDVRLMKLSLISRSDFYVVALTIAANNHLNRHSKRIYIRSQKNHDFSVDMSPSSEIYIDMMK